MRSVFFHQKHWDTATETFPWKWRGGTEIQYFQYSQLPNYMKHSSTQWCTDMIGKEVCPLTWNCEPSWDLGNWSSSPDIRDSSLGLKMVTCFLHVMGGKSVSVRKLACLSELVPYTSDSPCREGHWLGSNHAKCDLGVGGYLAGVTMYILLLDDRLSLRNEAIPPPALYALGQRTDGYLQW